MKDETIYNIVGAGQSMAPSIAPLIMEAMNADCCRYFMGPNHELSEFESMMTALVQRPDSQYSYRNTLVAQAHDGSVAGICVCYDGASLHALRQAFVDEMAARFGRDFTGMDDETASGELYVDSLCVARGHRGRGLAARLLQAAGLRARQAGLPQVGLLVDEGNPDAERLYRRVGFVFAGESAWGGHRMKHLVALVD